MTRCTKCYIEKQKDCYHKDQRSNSGYSKRCKVCCTKLAKERRKKKKEDVGYQLVLAIKSTIRTENIVLKKDDKRLCRCGVIISYGGSNACGECKKKETIKYKDQKVIYDKNYNKAIDKEKRNKKEKERYYKNREEKCRLNRIRGKRYRDKKKAEKILESIITKEN